MVSNMYDQCSHCFTMYHVNINTSYQITGFGLFCLAGGRLALEPPWPWELRTQDGKGFPLEKDVWTLVCCCEALPAYDYVIFPRGDCSASGLDASSEKNAVCHRPGNTPSSSAWLPPRVLLGGYSCTSSELFSTGSWWILRVCMCVCGGAVWKIVSHRTRLLKLQDLWSPRSSSISLIFGPFQFQMSSLDA